MPAHEDIRRYGRGLWLLLSASPRLRAARIPACYSLARDAAARGALQQPVELAALVAILGARRPRVVVEIGTAAGGTFFAWCRIAANDACLISIDLPEGDFGGGYPEAHLATLRSYGRPEQTLHFLRADSHAPSTLAAVEELLAGRAIDFLMIDGDHTYDGVGADYAMYGRLVGRDGIIAFHDIVPGSPDVVGEVPRFWSELTAGARRELVSDWSRGRFGIGVVHVV